MPIRPTGGIPSGATHQVDPKPTGRYQKSTRTAEGAFKNAIWKPRAFKAADEAPNAKESAKATKAAFSLFDRINRSAGAA